MFTRFLNTLRGLGFGMVNNIKKDLREQDKVSSGKLIAETRFTVRNTGSLITFQALAPKHWEFVDQGRAPGKFPPQRPIERWLRSKGLDPKLQFPVRRKIARDGIKGTNIYTNAIQEFKRNISIADNLAPDIQKQVSDILNNR